MTGLLLALAGGYGVHLLFTGTALRWSGLAVGPFRPNQPVRRHSLPAPLRALGSDLRDPGTVGSSAVISLVGGSAAYALFAGIVPAMCVALGGAVLPPAARRSRDRRNRVMAGELWPQILEEVRVLTSSTGRSIPQAMFEAGRRGTGGLRPAFDEAHRTWLVTTDFERSLRVLKDTLQDATADAACETLIVAHQLGGADLDLRLRALIDDRLDDLHDRKDAESRQAGARFSRTFVLLVPIGMAFTGLSIGAGRAAYATASGQVGVVLGMALVAVCWWWSGRLLRLPQAQRVFRP